ncbi:hypothetical protein CC86DRAFT_71416 [Ophiobolus disseminans]|uniref:Uncharacterized protein n=1 Tax=Ophiobolus disseminans TaxID=1469910 RepID=A0A6A6ZNU7_9PLEO|nr:hypothetical protein CC86DRAFT_71416 [Ophiobolus disseminans]
MPWPARDRIVTSCPWLGTDARSWDTLQPTSVRLILARVQLHHHMAPPSWRADLGFATRLTTATRISSAYQTSDPSIPAGEAHRKATIAETGIYDEANSSVRGDYLRRTQPLTDASKTITDYVKKR